MKHKISYLALSLLLLGSCSHEQVSFKAKTPLSDEEFLRYEKACQAMIDSPFRMSYSGTITEEYPEKYSYLNNTATATALSEYGSYENEDGTKKPAIRLIDGDYESTYYEDENGFAISAILNMDNTISTEFLTYFERKSVYSTYFANPFNSISGDDFDAEGNLGSGKAYYLLNSFTGISHSVNKAACTFDEQGRFASITFDFNRTPFGIPDGYDTLDGYRTMTGSIEFTYDVDAFLPLSPSKNENPELQAAFSRIGENYTMIIDSDVLAAPITVYADSKIVYIHYDNNKQYSTYGDKAYLLRAGAYRPYVFTSDWELSGSSLAREDILPRYDTASAAIFEQVSSSTYKLLSEASQYTADKFFLPQLGLDGGYGQKLTAKVSGEDLILTGLFVGGGNYETVKAKITDVGTTTIPSWIVEKDITK